MGLLLLMGDSQPNVRSLFGNNEPGLALDIGDRYGASEAKRTWRRNLLGYSNTPSNTGWLKFYATATENAGTSPFGGSDAFKIVEDSTTNFHYIQTPSITLESGRTYTYSVYAKAAERSVFYLDDAVSPFAGSVKAVYDLASGTVSSSQDCTPFIEDAGNGWYRCGWTATADTSGSARMQIVIGDNSYLGDGASGVLFYGSQLEAGSLTEYQPITDFSTEFKQAYPTHSLYQDSNGVTPAVYPNDPVGLVIDSGRGGLANLGPELVGNGTFDSDTTGWSAADANAAIEVASGRLKVTTISGSTGGRQAFSSVAGRFYRVTGEMEVESGTFGVRIDSPLGTVMYSSATHTSASGLVSFSFIVSAASTQFVVYLRASTAGAAYFDNISVKEIPGVHAYQTTSGSRPLLCRTPFSGRRNVLTYSEQFDNPAWTKVRSSISANATTAPDGTATADKLIEDSTASNSHDIRTASLSVVNGQQYTYTIYAKASERTWIGVYVGFSSAATVTFFDLQNTATGTVSSNATASISDVGNGWKRCQITVTANTTSGTIFTYLANANGGETYTGDGTSGVFIWGAQLEVGSSATNLQKVVTTTDVTEAGKADCWGLLADGVDDFLQTPSISFNTWTQATRRNLLVDTESFGASTWTKLAGTITENTTTAPNGTTTADTYTGSGVSEKQRIGQTVTATGGNTFSLYVKAGTHDYVQIFHNSDAEMVASFDILNGVVGFTGTKTTADIEDVGDGWFRCSAYWNIVTTGAIALLLVNDENAIWNESSDTSGYVYLWGAQVEAGTLTDYQRVGTDKMTVMAGVRKNSDAATGVVTELTTNAGNNGAFGLFAPAESGTVSYRFVSTGSSNAVAGSGVFAAAPDSAVLTGIGDISGDEVTLRRNGGVIQTATTNQGSGNYSNAVLYIGRRGSSTLPFSGILYSLIVRGAATSLNDIKQFEKWTANKAGITI